VTIFVIIAIVIVLSIGVYFAARGYLGVSPVPEEFQPIYDSYESCIKSETVAAIDLAGSQGGHVFLDDYVPGSDYAPFSNQLNFLGFPVPYWFYVSGNGIVKENVPSKGDIENGIAEFVRSRISDCDLEKYYSQGFYVDLGEPEVSVDIEDTEVLVSVSSRVVASREEESARKTKHEVEISSKLGKFYDIARDIYTKEKENYFLEEYAVDVLHSYTPVDGVEIGCSGKIWKTRDVVEDLKSGLEGNIGAVKVDGDYYKLSNKESEYFVVDVKSDEAVSFLYNKAWPSKIEIVGASDELMIAEPVGNQKGMGAMGFCYAPYHFVYDVSFPVLIQVYDSEEIFQFPVVVVIDNNLPREGIFSEVGEDEVSQLCDFATQDVEIQVFDVNLNPVDVDLSYGCFNQQCRLGMTEEGRFVGKVPACVNGYVETRAEGYADISQLFSSNEESSLDIVLDREHEVEIELLVGGEQLDGTAIVSFEDSDGGTSSAALPDSDSVRLSEGLYEITVYVYGDSEIVIPESKKTQCVKVPRSGILGVFGLRKEQCFEIVLPETKIEYALVGGGTSEVFILESEIESGEIVISVDSLPTPDSLEQLQYNYEAFDFGGVDLLFS